MDSNYTLPATPWNMVRNRTRQLGDTLCEIKEPYTYIFTTALIILSVVGTIENSLVLIAIGKYKTLRSPNLFFISALAALDLLTSSIVIPLYVVLTLNPSASWHKASVIIMTVIVALSLLTAVYISVDRFAHVYYLQKYNMTQKKSIMCLLFLWVIPFVLFFLIRWLVFKFAGRRPVRFATRGIAVVLITLCITAIVGAYTGILILLRRHAKNMKDTMQDNLNHQSRASKTSLIIVVCVVLMNTPTLIYTILLLTGTESPAWFCTITLITLLGSSALNPFVYLLRMPIMKEHVLKLICYGRKNEEDEDQAKLASDASTRTMSVTIVKNKDSMKLLKKKDQEHEVSAV